MWKLVSFLNKCRNTAVLLHSCRRALAPPAAGNLARSAVPRPDQGPRGNTGSWNTISSEIIIIDMILSRIQRAASGSIQWPGGGVDQWEATWPACRPIRSHVRRPAATWARLFVVWYKIELSWTCHRCRLILKFELQRSLKQCKSSYIMLCLSRTSSQ